MGTLKGGVGRVAFTGVVMVLGVGISTAMVTRYARLAVLGLIGLVGVQLLFVGIGFLSACRVQPQRLLGALLVASVVAGLLGVLAGQPEGGKQLMVGWRSGPWVVMVLPGVLVFAVWIGSVLRWSVLQRGNQGSTGGRTAVEAGRTGSEETVLEEAAVSRVDGGGDDVGWRSGA